MANPDYLRDLKEMHSRQEQLYAAAYEAYLANDNDSVRSAAEYARTHYPTSQILPKFLFIDALTYATQGDAGEFRSRLKHLVETYPQADMAPLAAGWLRESLKGRKINSSGTNVRGMIWATRLTNDSTMLAAATDSLSGISFERDADAPHLVVLAFAVDTINPNILLYNVARYNFATFAVRDFDLEPMQFGPLGLLAVKGFADRAGGLALSHHDACLSGVGDHARGEADSHIAARLHPPHRRRSLARRLPQRRRGGGRRAIGIIGGDRRRGRQQYAIAGDLS